MHLYSLLEFKFFFHFGQFGLVILLHLIELILLLHNCIFFTPFMVMFSKCSLLNMYFLFFNYIFLKILFLFLHVLHSIFIVVVFLNFGLLSIFFNIHIGLLLLIFQKFQFLQEDLDLCVMILLHILCLGLFVKYFCLHFLYL